MTESAIEKIRIDLSALCEGVPALSPALGNMMAESAAVCLDNRGHLETTVCQCDFEGCAEFDLAGLPVTDEMRHQIYTDLQDATEDGASGIAILLVRHLTGLTAVQRAVKGPGCGFDYWLGPINSAPDTLAFQDKARLEVSGILNGDEKDVKARVRKKLAQISASDDMQIPGYVAVIEFGCPAASVVKT